MLHKDSIHDRPVLSQRAFWDTDLAALHFDRHSRFIITRVFERGSEADQQAILKHYGRKTIIGILTGAPSLMPIAKERAKRDFQLSDQDFACYKSKLPARPYRDFRGS